jgi:purine-binding chemotaxis protein CheW
MGYSNQTEDAALITGFKLNSATFGVDARLVMEVVKVGELTPVHGAPRGVKGIINLRGHIVTVVDLSEQLGLGKVLTTPDTRLLIMEDEGESYGFMVDSVTDSFAIDEGNMEAPPSSINPSIRTCLLGVYRKGDDLTAIINPKTLFNLTEEA